MRTFDAESWWHERIRRAAWQVNDVAEEVETANAEGRELSLADLRPVNDAIMRLRDAARENAQPKERKDA